MPTRIPRAGRDIRSRQHIRTRESLRTSTGPGRASWPRVRETERLRLARARLARRRGALKEPRLVAGLRSY